MENIVLEYIRQYPIIGVLAVVIAIIAAINLAKTALQAIAASAVVLMVYIVFLLATGQELPPVGEMLDNGEQLKQELKSVENNAP